MKTRCANDVPLATLIDYTLGALGTDEGAFEAHLFGCASCGQRLEVVAALREGVRVLAASGRVLAGVTADHLARLADSGLRLRTYRIAPGGSVHCTIAPGDDANVVRLEADFTGVEEVDLRVHLYDAHGERSTEPRRAIAVDRAAGEAVLLFPGEIVRAFPQATFRLELAAAGGRRLGEYTMHHTPWSD